MPRVATLTKGSFLRRQCNPGPLPGGYLGTAVELRAAPTLKARVIALSTGPFGCGVYGAVKSRRISRPLQKSTNILFEYYFVRLSVRNARGTPISATKRFTAEKMDKYHGVPRTPERSRIRPSGIVVDKPQGLRR